MITTILITTVKKKPTKQIKTKKNIPLPCFAESNKREKERETHKNQTHNGILYAKSQTIFL